MVCFFPHFTSLITLLDHNPALTSSPASLSNDVVGFSTFHRSGHPVDAETVLPTSSEFAFASSSVSHTPSDFNSVRPSPFSVLQAISIFYDNVVHSRGVGI